MRNLSLSIICSALVCGGITFANNSVSNGATLKGVKPFIGYMVGTLNIDKTYTYNYSSYNTTRFIISKTSIQTGLWGGLEFNFMEKLGIRAYANILTTVMPTSSSESSTTSSYQWIFSGNVDLVYRPTQSFGIFIGFGLGDTMSGSMSKSKNGVTSNTDNNFTMMSNFGVQYNINANNILELSAIINSVFTFTTYDTTTSNTSSVPLYSPSIDISHSIMAKYAYRF